MVTISLGRKGDRFCLVDRDDVERLSRFSWSFDGRYACRYFHLDGVMNKVYMHREIIGVALVDHVNQNKLDNRKINLRSSNHSLNGANRGSARKGLLKGIVFIKSGKKKKRWAAKIQVNRKPIFLGLHLCPIEAHLAYRIAAKKYFGEFASC